MIGRLVERLAREVDAADLVEAAEDRITATVDAAGDVACEMATTATAHARVFNGGRVGWAAGQAERGDEVVDAAIRSAAGGEALECHLPVPSPLPGVATAAPGVSGLGHLEVLGLARTLRDRLAGPGRRLEVWAERVVGSVRVSNTRGVTAEYPRTMVGVGAVARGAGGGGHAPGSISRSRLQPCRHRASGGRDRSLARCPCSTPGLSGRPGSGWRLAPVRTLLWPLLDPAAGRQHAGARLSLDPRTHALRRSAGTASSRRPADLRRRRADPPSFAGRARPGAAADRRPRRPYRQAGHRPQAPAHGLRRPRRRSQPTEPGGEDRAAWGGR
ncbi:MAG: hypothetical protein R2909_06350 [Gemmatimonadales bacterium]